MTLKEFVNLIPIVNEVEIRMVEFNPDVFHKTIFCGTYNGLLAHFRLKSNMFVKYMDMPIEQIDIDGENRLLIVLDNGRMFSNYVS